MTGMCMSGPRIAPTRGGGGGARGGGGGPHASPLPHICQAPHSLPILAGGGDEIMLISRRELGGLVPAALAGWPLIAAAQSPDAVGQIANYSGENRQAMLEAGAKRERGLLLYTTGTQIEPLIRGFERKYPFLK